MGIVGKETGVLKLVRAGGIVELYKHPIKAAQIMERYPRHCVTRPDFFRYPCIVVKPESVLKPGKVFFIVPYHTIYRLLKSKGYRCNRHYTHDDHNDQPVNPQTLENITRRRLENIDTSFFHKIIPAETVRSKKQSGKRSNGDYDSDEVSSCFHGRKLSMGRSDVTASESGCLKPCLKKNRPDKKQFQRGTRVRFMLPNDDDDDDYDDDDFEMSFVLP